MKRFFLIIIAILAPLLLSAQQGQKAKYVFYFIGDGMGFNHVSITEYWLGYTEGKFGSSPLSFTRFPILGWAVTHSASNLITDSAAAGTALSTGSKTNNGMLGVTPDSSDVQSIAYKIHDAGYKVGISSTVGINHATPGAFYGHNTSRSSYYEIASELPETDFEFFAGGGILESTGDDHDQPSIYDAIEDSGYIIAEGMDQFNAKKSDARKNDASAGKRPFEDRTALRN